VSFWRSSKSRMKVTFIPAFRTLERRGGPIWWISLVASCPSVAAPTLCFIYLSPPLALLAQRRVALTRIAETE